jgi:hypothetical protein
MKLGSVFTGLNFHPNLRIGPSNTRGWKDLTGEAYCAHSYGIRKLCVVNTVRVAIF